jgi:hypothetical protein
MQARENLQQRKQQQLASVTQERVAANLADQLQQNAEQQQRKQQQLASAMQAREVVQQRKQQQLASVTLARERAEKVPERLAKWALQSKASQFMIHS